MSKDTINQRLKFLVESLSTSVRAFSEAINDSSSNTNNYIGSRQTEPKPVYLAKVISHFSNVSAHWLLTGEGEPFIGEAPNPPAATTNKKNKGPVQSSTGSHATNNITTNLQLDDCRRDLAGSQKEVEHLQAQLAAKDAVIASKDALIASQAETLSLLRGGYTRPN